MRNRCPPSDDDVHTAIVGGLHIDYPRECAHRVRLGRPANLDARPDERHPKLQVVVEAALYHQLVPLLEDVKRQEAVGEQRHVQGKQGKYPLSVGHDHTVRRLSRSGYSSLTARTGLVNLSRLLLEYDRRWGFV